MPCPGPAAILCIVLVVLGVGAARCDAVVPVQRRLLLPAFEGPGEVGVVAANVIALQIGRSFRIGGAKAGDAGAFGEGVFHLDLEPLKEMTFEEAMRRALRIDVLAHLVLWGRAYSAGDQVVVQAFLTATPVLYELTRQRPELWVLEYRPAGTERATTLTADLPSAHFAFAPIVLSAEVVKRYGSIPGLVIYADRHFTRPLGHIGHAYRALRYEPDAVYLSAGKLKGWVQLTDLGRQESEVSTFASALFRLLRADWTGAAELFERVLQMPQLSRTLRIDALLMLGLAHEKQGRSGRGWFREAMQLNPFRVETCRYLVQAEIADLKRNPTDRGRVPALEALLDRCRVLFNPEDEWLKNVQFIVGLLR